MEKEIVIPQGLFDLLADINVEEIKSHLDSDEQLAQFLVSWHKAMCNELYNLPKNSLLCREVRNEVIESFRSKLSKEMCDLWNWWKKDKQNRPKPDFTNAIAMVELIAEVLKEQKNE